eukprot:281302-Hanusia_phi.AAC.1
MPDRNTELSVAGVPKPLHPMCRIDTTIMMHTQISGPEVAAQSQCKHTGRPPWGRGGGRGARGGRDRIARA